MRRPWLNLILAVFLLLCVPAFTFWPTLSTPRLSSFDDRNLIAPLAHVSSWKDYTTLLQAGVILDRQPLRDASFVAEFKIRDATGLYNPQLVNFILWISTVFVTWLILRELGVQTILALCAVAWLAVHPVVVNSVAWPSARKHLLSALFTVLATWLWLKARKRKQDDAYWMPAVGAYILACLSQPINVLWSLWAAALAPKSLLRNSLLAMVAIATLAVNYAYYSGSSFSTQSGGSKFLESGSTLSNVGYRCLALGRYAYQILLPTHPSVAPYDARSEVNFIGLFILAGFLFWFLRRRRSYDQYVWLGYIFAPLAVVTLPATGILGWDTYLLIPLVGLTILVVNVLAQNQKVLAKITKHKGAALASFTIILALFVLQSRSIDQAWTSDATMWERSLASDSSYLALSAMAKHAVNTGSNSQAAELIQKIQERWPNAGQLGYLQGHLIYNQHLPPAEMESRFNEAQSRSPWFLYYWSVGEAANGDFVQAERRLRQMIEANPEATIAEFRESNTEMFATWAAVCELSHLADCKDKLQSWRTKVPPLWWDEAAFKTRFELLTHHP